MRSSSPGRLSDVCMNEVLATYAAVDALVRDRNGEVIGRAFSLASVHCSDCNYPPNAKDFDYWLRVYTGERIELHRATKRRDRHWYCGCSSREGPYGARWTNPCSTCNDLSQDVYRIEREAKSSREELEECWPCVECIKRYNPTARIRHLFKTQPELKGFLDVRY